MKEDTSNTTIKSDEATLRELILNIKEYGIEILKGWKIIALIAMVITMYMLYQAHNTPILYSATYSFMLEEEQKGGIGGLSSLLGGGGGGDFNLNKVSSLVRSRNIIQRVLFKKGECDGKTDYFANHLIHDLNLHESWKENDNLRDFVFKHGDYESFNRIENSVLKSIYGRISIGKNEGLLTTKKDDNSGITTMNFKAKSEDLAIRFITTIYEELSRFYTENATEKQQKTLDLTTAKTDSLKTLLDASELNVLRLLDRNRNISLRQYEADRISLERKVQFLTLAYGEALKNQELARFTLDSETPYFQTLDKPIPPISATAKNYLSKGILGIFLGGFMGSIFIILRKLFREIMNEKTV